MRRLRDGRLDLGIFPETDDQAGLDSEPLLPEEPLAAFMAPDHPLAANELVGPEDLNNEPVFVYQSAYPALWESCRKRLEDVGYRFNMLRDVVGSTDARDGLLAAAIGRGLVLLPASLLETLDAGALVARRPLQPSASMPHGVVAWRADPSPQLARVLSQVRQIARDLYEHQA
jgi:DNA-binding transcriptional LysR family regulator